MQNKSMGDERTSVTKITTAMMFAGPKSIGSFGDEDGWRIGLTCQVVDGGSNGPFLICAMPGKEELIIHWQGLEMLDGAHALLLALAIFYGDASVHGWLLETENVTQVGDELTPAPFFEFAPEVERQLVSRMKSIVKLGVITLAPDSSLKQEMVEYLVRRGLSVERFSSVPNPVAD